MYKNDNIGQKISPELMERLRKVAASFGDTRFVSRYTPNKYAKPLPTEKDYAPKPAKHWREALKDDDDKSGGGGGTMKGLRGKDAQNAKNAMRKLTRNR